MKKFIFALALLGGAQVAMATEWVRATVVKTDPARGRVTLDHAAIKSLPMEAMVMPFKVSDRALLAGLKPGDKVQFTVGTVNDELTVTGLKVMP